MQDGIRLKNVTPGSDEQKAWRLLWLECTALIWANQSYRFTPKTMAFVRMGVYLYRLRITPTWVKDSGK